MTCSSPSSPGSWSPDIRQIMSDMYKIQDMAALDLFRHLKAISHLLSLLIGEYRKDEGQLSQARMRLLVRLAIENKMGSDTGLSPSELSDYLRISRNTVSALLNGLQEQGLIERHLHPTDRRQFLIRITPAGHELVNVRAPQFAVFIAGLFEDLSSDERQMLFDLLDKLYRTLLNRAVESGINLPGVDSETQHEPT